MGKAKRKKATKKNKVANKKRIRHEVFGVFLIGLGLFTLFSIYTNTTGIFGYYFRRILMGLFGITAYAIPILIMIIGILVIVAYYKKINKSKIVLSIMSFIFILCIIHMLYFKYYKTDDLIEFIKSSYENGIDEKGAGALLSPIVYFSYKLLGLIGTYILLVVVFIITLIILTNLSFKNVVTYMCDKIDNQKSAKRAVKKKPFSGATVKFKTQDNKIPDIEFISDSFQKQSNKTGKKDSNSADNDLQIIEIEPSTENTKEALTSNTNNEKIKESIKTLEMQSSPDVYNYPTLELLKKPKAKKGEQNSEKYMRYNAKILEKTLNSFGVDAKVAQVSKGPVITRYEVQPAPGVKVSKIVNLSDDIALNLATSGIRIEAPIPGKAAVGIEVPNKSTSPVLLREVLEGDVFNRHVSKLAFALGKDIAGRDVIADIAKMPHLLIAGATGSGKSVCINTLVISILYKASPKDVKLIMIDPKVVELSNYNGIPHLMFPVVTDPKKAANALNWVVQEMIDRYKLFADKGVRDLERYNELQIEQKEKSLPQIIVIIDELSDLMMAAPNEVEDSICRLAQMARAAGIHLVIATQRPSVDVITGLIKANIPSRIAFAVSSSTDSRTILDMGGAEKLLGKGDMLYYPVGANKPIRVQGAYVSEKEIENVVNFIKSQDLEFKYNEEAIEEIETLDYTNSNMEEIDELFPDAIELVVDAGQASISMLQRRLRIGYARAARLIDEMEIRGIVSGFEGSKPRDVLISREEFEEKYKNI